jgi:hypothetical protein
MKDGSTLDLHPRVLPLEVVSRPLPPTVWAQFPRAALPVRTLPTISRQPTHPHGKLGIAAKEREPEVGMLLQTSVGAGANHSTDQIRTAARRSHHKIVRYNRADTDSWPQPTQKLHYCNRLLLTLKIALAA